jgi:tetratricopeptide (TPR) repeat protein
MKLYPTSHVFHDALGILLDAEGKHEGARKEFMISGRLRSDPYWKVELAVSWALSKNYRKALEALESARLNGATGGSFSLNYGRVLHAMGECDRAEVEFQKARREYRRLPELLKAISDLYFDQGRFLLASKFSLLTGFSLIRISWISTLINFRDAFLGLVLTVGCFTGKKLWVVVRWIPLLRAIQQRFLPPDEPERSLARRLIEQGYLILAEKQLRTACKILPRKAANFGNLAATLFRQGKVKEAVEVNAIALSIEPENRAFKHNKEAFEMGRFEDRSNIVWDAKRGKYRDLKKGKK